MSALRNRVLRLERMTPADEGDKVRAIFLVAPFEPIRGYCRGGLTVMREGDETIEQLERRCELMGEPGIISLWEGLQ